jgi:hypothetical protein
MDSGRLPEAALFARSYAPSLMKQPLQVNGKAVPLEGEVLGDPGCFVVGQSSGVHQQ